MKKILFLHSSSEMYGSDKSLLNLISGLDKDKFIPYVMLPSTGILQKELEKIEKCKVLIYPLAILRRKDFNVTGLSKYSLTFFKSVYFIKNIIKKNQIDIVYTNTSVVLPGGIAAKLAKKKSVWHIREIISNKYENFIIKQMVNRFSDIIIGNSKATLSAIVKSNKKGKVIYNTIQTSVVKKEKSPKKNLVIGMAGRINRWKGQELFIESAIELLKKDPTLNFVIAGDVFAGEEFLKLELQKKIVNSGYSDRIKLLGLLSDMNEFYNSIDIFILPSIKPEPFGLVILEAMSWAVPVIATNFGGPAEIITDGENGLLFNPISSDELTQKILMLIEDKDQRCKIGLNGKRLQEAEFSKEKYVENIQGVLNELL